MKEYSIENLRNVALIAHSGAGKTSLGDAMLFISGGNTRLGKVDEGTSVLDFDSEEIRRKTTISTSVAPVEWKGTKINLLDTPGYFDFVGDVLSALRVVEGAVVVVDATGGVQVGTEIVWDYARQRNLSCIIAINKLDRENTDFWKTLEEVNRAFGGHVVPLYIPLGKEASFRGVVDVIGGKALVTQGEGKIAEQDIPQDLKDAVESTKEKLIETACDGDDQLMEKYIEGQELTPEEIVRGIKLAVLKRKAFPAIPASVAKTIGVHAIMDAIVAYVPSPADVKAPVGKAPGSEEEKSFEAAPGAPFSALVWKTTADPFVGKLSLFRVYSGKFVSNTTCFNATKGRSERVGQLYSIKGKSQEPVPEVSAGDIGAVAKLQETTTGDTLCLESSPIVYEPIAFPNPVYSVAVRPKTKGDEDKISAGLQRLVEEDPTIRVERNTETGETILSGLGEVHVDVTTTKLRDKFHVDVELSLPKVPYRETIKGTAKAEGKHKKQTGGRGQYGHVFIEFEPAPDKDFEFVDKIFGGAVPRQYIPAVEKGLREALNEGVLAGYPVTNLRAILYDGSYHPVDSSELAFKIAAALAFKKGCSEANPVLLEPIMRVEVMVPEQFMGDIMGDFNKRRGRILGVEAKGPFQIIKAMVPMAEMLKYAIDLRSMTQGRGVFKMEFDRYEEVPPQVAEGIIEAARKEKEKEKENK